MGNTNDKGKQDENKVNDTGVSGSSEEKTTTGTESVSTATSSETAGNEAKNQTGDKSQDGTGIKDSDKTTEAKAGETRDDKDVVKEGNKPEESKDNSRETKKPEEGKGTTNESKDQEGSEEESDEKETNKGIEKGKKSKEKLAGNLPKAIESRFKMYEDSHKVVGKKADDHAPAAGDLLSTIIECIETPDYDAFSEVFEGVLKKFNEGKDDLYNPLTFNIGDYRWQGKASKVKAYPLISFILTTLCDPETREEKLKTISLTNISGISSQGLENLIKFFEA